MGYIFFLNKTNINNEGILEYIYAIPHIQERKGIEVTPPTTQSIHPSHDGFTGLLQSFERGDKIK